VELISQTHKSSVGNRAQPMKIVVLARLIIGASKLDLPASVITNRGRITIIAALVGVMPHTNAPHLVQMVVGIQSMEC
jgi:hypothetical protein